MRKLAFLPLILFLGLAAVFWWQLGKDPSKLPSALIDRPVPAFDLPPIPGRDDHGLSSADLTGQVTLLNVFGSWCVACLAEHPMLNRIQQLGLVPLNGIDWRDEPAKAAAWLKKHGDPFDRIGMDPKSHVAIDLGVTGAPETFVIDKTGAVRYKHVGPITPDVWRNTLKPLVEELQSQ